MKNYERLIATPGMYGHITRKGSGSPQSMEVLDSTGTDTYSPDDGSFAYLIMPGSAGVKFSVMEEDGVRASATRLAYTYPAGTPVTGRFNRLKVDAGACAIYLAQAGDYQPAYPYMGQLALGTFRINSHGQIIVPIVMPETYNLFHGEDFGFRIAIAREDLEDLADISFGDILLRDDDEETVATLNAYGHADTELLATLADEVATYYLATSNTDLSGNDAYDALKTGGATHLLINLQLKVEGDYTIGIEFFEVNEETNVLEKAGLIFDTKNTQVSVPEPNDEALILTFGIEDQEGDTVIDHEAGTIALTMPFGTTVTALVAEFTTSPHIASIEVGSTDQVSGTTANNFTGDVTYVVTAEDNTATKEYVVTVSLGEEPE